jgi:hypothetical protein
MKGTRMNQLVAPTNLTPAGEDGHADGVQDEQGRGGEQDGGDAPQHDLEEVGDRHQGVDLLLGVAHPEDARGVLEPLTDDLGLLGLSGDHPVRRWDLLHREAFAHVGLVGEDLLELLECLRLADVPVVLHLGHALQLPVDGLGLGLGGVGLHEDRQLDVALPLHGGPVHAPLHQERAPDEGQ